MTTDQAKLDIIFSRLDSAFVDGRLDNLAFKHKQLYILFSDLQKADLVKGSQQLTLELETTLRSISTALSSLPTDLTGQYRCEQLLKDVGEHHGSRSKAVGIVVIVVDEAHPYASWAIPLSQAIINGNPCLVVTATNTNVLSSGLPRGLDSTAYQHVSLDRHELDLFVSSSSNIAGLVGPASQLPKTLTLKARESVNFQLPGLNEGAVPVIIDQSALSNGQPLSVRQENDLVVPDSVSIVAKQIAAALAVGDHEMASLGAPSYLLAHENIVQPLLRALKDELPTSLETHLLPLVENFDKIKGFLEALKGRRPSFLPVYSVRSFDMALDFVQYDIPRPAALYIFASKRFGAYAFDNLKGFSTIGLNIIPREVLALGPYAKRDSFDFSTRAHIVHAHRPSLQIYESSQDQVKSVKARQLNQPAGNRIDFFGGSFLLAGGLTASVILGGIGYGVFKTAVFTWTLWKARSH
ncbi:hypothetical protein CI109_104432 [Kwoniella shandongensis]|uniref:Uncharacterized protein n=1 Tax=Kwoniella shandongensis TaxID=1734106 RepID=A0A5M6BWT4_9TREE|nr:uncharacterized protein CI109_004170 [Kwoniella shandongensis]KAA5527358.1 hypothetical protein CI109_004170 [Kwoniella shandongensis]